MKLLYTLAAISLVSSTPLASSNVSPCDQAWTGTGKCRAAFQRWYFNKNENACKQYIYGGCGANENIWDDEGLCLKSCGNDETTTVFIRKPSVSKTLSNSDNALYDDENTKEYYDQYGDYSEFEEQETGPGVQHTGPK